MYIFLVTPSSKLLYQKEIVNNIFYPVNCKKKPEKFLQICWLKRAGAIQLLKHLELKLIVLKLWMLLWPIGLKRLRSAGVDDVEMLCCVYLVLHLDRDGQCCVLRFIKHSSEVSRCGWMLSESLWGDLDIHLCLYLKGLHQNKSLMCCVD